MDAAFVRALCDKHYDRRKKAALDLEVEVKEYVELNERAKFEAVLEHLVQMAAGAQSMTKVGGVMGLAAVGIALNAHLWYYLPRIMPPVIQNFRDPDGKVRYFSCEALYNLTKAAQGEMLVYFNDVFDALSRIVADSEVVVRNGAELINRTLKDIVALEGATYVSFRTEVAAQAAKRRYIDSIEQQPREQHESSSQKNSSPQPANGDYPAEASHANEPHGETVRANLPETKPGEEGAAAELAEEGKDTDSHHEEQSQREPQQENADEQAQQELTAQDSDNESEPVKSLNETFEHDPKSRFLESPTRRVEDNQVPPKELALSLARLVPLIKERIKVHNVHTRMFILGWLETLNSIPELDLVSYLPEFFEGVLVYLGDKHEDVQLAARVLLADLLVQIRQAAQVSYVRKTHGWDDVETRPLLPGEGVSINYAAIIEILLRHLSVSDNDVQATGLHWISEFLKVAPNELMSFTPQLISISLSALAHTNSQLSAYAMEANQLLYAAVESVLQKAKDSEQPSVGDEANEHIVVDPTHPFKFADALDALGLRFLSTNENTLCAALAWLKMLHNLAPQYVLKENDQTFPVLLKTLSSDASDQVVRLDLDILAQASSHDDAFFLSFMRGLLTLFSSDRKLLDARGFLIIHQLCVDLNPEKIFYTSAQILEQEDDLDFAALMVQKLCWIMVSSPHLTAFRRHLRQIGTLHPPAPSHLSPQKASTTSDLPGTLASSGNDLFIVLFRSWSHSPMAAFLLCLLVQAYEQAFHLIYVFSDMEVTLELLLQVDKVVQLLESPVFATLRLQLLEPDRNPFLVKALYGLLMILPQSSAFATLRNRLNAVSPLALPTLASSASSSAKPRRSLHEPQWTNLLAHFRAVQERHEAYRHAQSRFADQ